MTRADRRAARLACLALVLIGGAITASIPTGWLDGMEGTAWFPLSLVAGIVGLAILRPRRGKPPTR